MRDKLEKMMNEYYAKYENTREILQLLVDSNEDLLEEGISYFQWRKDNADNETVKQIYQEVIDWMVDYDG